MNRSAPGLLLFVFLLSPAVRTAGAEGDTRPITAADFLAARVRITLCDLLGEIGPGGDARGSRLADYSARPAGDPDLYESTSLAARRIIAAKPAVLRTPDEAAVWLVSAAQQLEQTAEGSADEPRRRDLRATARLAHFHGCRLIAAVRYNLFKRSLSLAELYAAVREEQRAVAVWRDLVRSAADDRRAPFWREELIRLEDNLRDLEAQCCPPKPGLAAAPVWQPAGR